METTFSHAFTGTARFELIRQLGEGGFGIVYEAFDRERSIRVALKLLRQAEGSHLYRFKREFRALTDVSHPNLVALHELLTDGLHWFFTMELVHGASIVSFARPSVEPEPYGGAVRGFGKLDEGRLRSALPQLADALNTIHRLGIVHRDIKPSNILVTPEGRVVVLDFGLVSEQDPSEAAAELESGRSSEDLVVLGTPSYMAPEQGTFHSVTPAADWYSVGTILYEALTGHLPFTGSKLDVINAKQWRRPRPPSELAAQVPRDLEALCMKLLDADPGRRADGKAFLELIGSTASPVATRIHTPAVSEDLMGRDSQLQRLRDAFETARRRQTVVAFVSGPSGVGKSALIRHFLSEERTRDQDLLALTSRCYERESMPYKALDPLIDALARHLRQLRDIEVARRLPRDAAILARLFPVLMGIEEVRRAPALDIEAVDSLTVRQRAAAALRDLLFAVAIREPLVLVIDDAQWGDIDSASLLQQILRTPDAPPLLLVVAYRSEDAGEAALLRALRSSVGNSSALRVYDIALDVLTHKEAFALAMRLTADTSESRERAEAIARESGGNPFFVHELVQHAMTFRRATRLDAVVLDRVGALPQPARRLVMAVALSAQPVPAHVAGNAAGVPAQDPGPLQLLRTSRLVRIPGRPGEPTVEPYHDRIREALASQVSGPELEEWHRRLATAWEESGLARPETLVAHFLAAGDNLKTCEYAVRAAEKADEALAFDRAAHFYDLLVRLEAQPERQRRWFIKLGDALANAGRGHDAAVAFLKALDIVSDSEPVDIDLERRAAAELIRAGYLDKAMEVLDRLLPKVGVTPPKSESRALLKLLRYQLLLRIRGTRFRERAELEIAPEDLRRIDVLTSVAYPLALVALARGNALNMQATWHALRAGEKNRVVTGLAGLAASTAMSGTRTAKRSRRLVDQAQALASTLQDPWPAGRVALGEGIFLKVNGRWKEGTERLERAITIFSGCKGARWEVETAQTLIHDALYWMGEWSRLARELPARRQEAEQRGDLYSATHVAARLSPIVHMAADRIEDARREAETGLANWTKRHYHLQHRWGVCTGVDIDLYTGNIAEAARRLNDAWPALRAIMFLFQNGRIEMLFYRARIALALAAGGDLKALRRANSDARRLYRERAPWATALAQLVRATVSLADHKVDLVAARLEVVEASLRLCHMNHYAAAARYRRGKLIGGDAGRGLAESAVEWMHAQSMVNPARLVELLAPGPWPRDGVEYGENLK
jgi:serine/threonine protein kinase